MQNYESASNKNSCKISDEGNVHGYTTRKCDLKCYKCRYQGVCVIPRRIIEARKRFIRNNKLGMDLFNNEYRFNHFLPIFGYKKKLLIYLVTNPRKRKLYGKDSD
jgi:hypothetical protein